MIRRTLWLAAFCYYYAETWIALWLRDRRRAAAK